MRGFETMREEENSPYFNKQSCIFTLQWVLPVLLYFQTFPLANEPWKGGNGEMF